MQQGCSAFLFMNILLCRECTPVLEMLSPVADATLNNQACFGAII
jgi:hypothetical protein